MGKANLTVVIHTEEEFDWDGGFYRSNNQVTHGNELVAFGEKIISTGVKLILAMDYAFVVSEGGKMVIEHFKNKAYSNFEFATHLHPWVNPPFEDDNDLVSEFNSYPGNLPYNVEEQKLTVLTDVIEVAAGIRPTTYLAGRYGVGENTYKILKKLGYKVDLSISPFADFSHQQGPDFSQFDNSPRVIESIQCIPHSTGYISRLPWMSNYLNKSPNNLKPWNSNFLGKVLLKLLGVKRVRLSPEGFSLVEQTKLYKSLRAVGVNTYVYSFHSPSVKVGLTPYVKTMGELEKFQADTLIFLNEICH